MVDALMTDAPTDVAAEATTSSPQSKDAPLVLLEKSFQEAKEALEKSVTGVKALRLEKEEQCHKLLMALTAMRARNTELEKQCKALASNEESNSERAKARLAEAKSSAAKISSLEGELAQMKSSYERLEREKRGNDELLARTMKKAAEDAEQASRLRDQVHELMSFRVSAESQLAAHNSTSLKLARDSQANALESAIQSKRCTFLEAERVRLSGELIEARSQLNVATAEYNSSMRSSREHAEKMRKDLASVNSRCDTLVMKETELKAKLGRMQKEREKAREDGLRETQKAAELLELQTKLTDDAQAEVKHLKEVLSALTEAKQHENAKKLTRQSLDAHAEALLKDLQKSLDAKLGDIEAQKEALEKALEAEARASVETQRLNREVQQGRRYVEETLQKITAVEAENKELKKKVATLENRILLAGTSDPVEQTPERMSSGKRPFAAVGFPQNTPSPFTYDRRTRPPSLGLDPVANATPPQLQKLMDEMRDLRQRHEGVLADLTSRGPGVGDFHAD